MLPSTEKYEATDGTFSEQHDRKYKGVGCQDDIEEK